MRHGGRWLPELGRAPLAAASCASLALLATGVGALQGEGAGGPFGLAEIATADGRRALADDFYLSSDCALCHPRQWSEMRGSMHSVSHEDTFYRRFAEMARREAGEEVYTYCSSCHSPVGVLTGSIPDVPEEELSPLARAGVTCDTCHVVSGLNGAEGRWGEPGNGSLVYSPGREKYGPYAEIERNPAHTGVFSEAHGSSEFCASCHTVIHPFNGLRLEHTYAEWKESVYAEAGIQCQDCHMRTVEDAIRVAETLEPVPVTGTLARKGPEREIAPHYFVGGNVEAGRLGGSERHGAMARERLRSAAELEVRGPAAAPASGEVELEVVVKNVGAGHALPTSLIELRQMWVHVRVEDAEGRLVFESGGLDEHGEIVGDPVRFGAGTLDAEGRHTYKPWEAEEFGWRLQVPPRGSVTRPVRFSADGGAGPLSVEARLLYRVAPPHVIDEVMGDEAFSPEVVQMAESACRIEITP